VADWLLIDQGNTRLKWLFARDGRIREESAGQGDFDIFSQAVSESTPARILFSSVAGTDAAEQVMAFSQAIWGLRAERFRSRAKQGGVRNAYATPESLGVDRWLAIVGAVARHGRPVVVWDLGTAATLDAVDADGRHLGGLILPGPRTMLQSLRRDTRLPVPEDPDVITAIGVARAAPGTSTAECISRGVFAAQVGALERFVGRLGNVLGGNHTLVVTGGAAEPLLPLLDFDYVHDPWLVFRGMLVE
jgi:type III pantothenate kinase